MVSNPVEADMSGAVTIYLDGIKTQYVRVFDDSGKEVKSPVSDTHLPASVVFDTIQAGKARGADVIIIDTAGRLHNKKNLMDELNKIEMCIRDRSYG